MDRDRRIPFTPAPGVPVLADPIGDEQTPVNRSELTAIREDLSLLLEAQTADRKQLNGRMGSLDGRLGGVEKEQRNLGTKVDGFDRKLDRLLGEKTADAQEKTADAKVKTALINLRKAKWTTVGKVVAAAVSAGLGLLIGHFLSGCV